MVGPEEACNVQRQIGTTVCVLQPGYLPWLGFFDQMCRSDVFVLYDDVQYDKHSWRNRNRIKSPSGPQWLTVPVRHKGLGWPKILDVEIDNQSTWWRKHILAIRQYYSKAPYLNRYLSELEHILQQEWKRRVDLDLAIIQAMSGWFGIKRTVVRSSALGIDGERSERLVKICQHFCATRYLSGDAAKNYLETDLFNQQGIQVEWQTYRHPKYPQLHGEFIPYLSALDLLLNCGDDSIGILLEGSREEGK